MRGTVTVSALVLIGARLEAGDTMELRDSRPNPTRLLTLFYTPPLRPPAIVLGETAITTTGKLGFGGYVAQTPINFYPQRNVSGTVTVTDYNIAQAPDGSYQRTTVSGTTNRNFQYNETVDPNTGEIIHSPISGTPFFNNGLMSGGLIQTSITNDSTATTLSRYTDAVYHLTPVTEITESIALSGPLDTRERLLAAHESNRAQVNFSGAYTRGTDFAWHDFPSGEAHIATARLRYKFLFAPWTKGTLHWAELFYPSDNPATPEDESSTATVRRLHSWQIPEGEIESPVYALAPYGDDPLDPAQSQRTLPPENGGYRIHPLDLGLIVDANRDGQITLAREAEDPAQHDIIDITQPYRFWSNDDDDNPGETPEKDYLNNVVDGEGDLLDFFPVFLDIRQLLTVLPPSASVKYKLKQADGGLNFVYTNLTRATAFSYKTGTLTTGFGPSFTQAAAVATTQQITAAGIELPAAFLTNIKDNDQGVILLEARQVSGAPLKLVVEKDNVQIAEVALNIASLRLYADPGTLHLGFDPPNKSESDAPNEYWASVVQGTTNTILNLDLPASALAGMEWKIAAADTSRVDISPKTFTSATTKLTITGLETGSNAPELATITLVPTGATGAQAILTLNVLVLRQREISLAIYKLEDPNAPLTHFATAPAVSLPSNQLILDVCNDTFKQAGIRFVPHPSSGPKFYPYDTKGVRIKNRAAEFDDTLDDRASDGVMTYGERLAMYFGLSAPNLTLYEVPVGGVDNAVRVIMVRQSGISYADVDATSQPPLNPPLVPDNLEKIRGVKSGEMFARDLKTPLQMALAIAHEVGHKFRLATANESSGSGIYQTDGHDQPPHPFCVHIDDPNGAPPVHPGNDIDTPRPYPNRVIMQGGAPESDGLPWMHGRWMSREDWEESNRAAGGLE